MVIKNRNMFRITRIILLRLPGLFKFFARFRKPRKRVQIIKTDAIGDYILFRNFIEIVKQSDTFKGYKIDLLGNSLWQDIALLYDKPFVEGFLFITPDDLYEAPLSAFKSGWQLFSKRYDTVLQPTFARTFINDALAAFTAAKHIIGFEGDTERINPKYKTHTDKFYTQKLQLPAGTDFEFDRSKFFFEEVLNQKITINGPHIPIAGGKKEGVIIFPGAGIAKRSWEKEKFLELIKYIKKETSQPVYLAGGPSEILTGAYLTENLPSASIYNLIGKTTLPQLVELIGNAALVITNETSAVHIAAATQTKAICILGGGHFGRFSPYPAYIQNGPLCIYEKMECYNCNWNCKFLTEPNEPHPCISTVNTENVWQAVKQLLPTV
jgi:ADP-heptose:LPS heptosyltransferase